MADSSLPYARMNIGSRPQINKRYFIKVLFIHQMMD